VESLRSFKTTEPSGSCWLPSTSISLNPWSLPLLTLPSAFVQIYRGVEQCRLSPPRTSSVHTAAQGREEAGRRLSTPSLCRRSRRSRSCSRRLRRSRLHSGPRPSPTSSSTPQGMRGRTPPPVAAMAQLSVDNDPISHHHHHSDSVERASVLR
jgi:hypothetical protein